MAQATQPATTTEGMPEPICEFPELFGDLAEMDTPEEPAPAPEKRKDLLFVPVLITPLPAPPPPPINLEPELTVEETAPIEAGLAAAPVPIMPQAVNLRGPVIEPTKREGAAPVLTVGDDPAPALPEATAPEAPMQSAPAPTVDAVAKTAPAAEPAASAPPQLAFAVRLMPIQKDTERPAAVQTPRKIDQHLATGLEPKTVESAPQVQPEHPVATGRDAEPDDPRPTPSRLEAPSPAEAPARESVVMPVIGHGAAPVAASVESARLEPAAAPKPIEHTAPPEPISEPAPLKSSARAHDIKLAVADGDRRVEVRVSERAGEIRVAVRTPDSRLSGDLRENLPSLSSRLEQTGFRTEPWRPAAPAQSEAVRFADASVSSGRQSADGQAEQRQPDRQGGHDSSRSRHQDESPNRKQKGKEFEWLMSSLR
jgi:hypothetical protein